MRVGYLNNLIMLWGKADYYRQVVLKIPGMTGGNLGSVFTWDDQPDIRNARTVAIEAYTASSCAFSQPALIPLIPDNLANLISFRFETNDPDDVQHKKGAPLTQGASSTGFTGTLATVQWMPFTRLNVMQSYTPAAGNPPANFVRDNIVWMDRYIIWQKSDVWIAGGGLKNTTDMAIVLGVYYSFLTDDNKPIVR